MITPELGEFLRCQTTPWECFILQVEQPEKWNQILEEDLEVLNAPNDSEMDEIIEALNNGLPFRASVYRSQHDTTFYFAGLWDAQEYLAQSVSIDIEFNPLEGISLETLEDGEWVDTGFTLRDAYSMARTEDEAHGLADKFRLLYDYEY